MYMSATEQDKTILSHHLAHQHNLASATRIHETKKELRVRLVCFGERNMLAAMVNA